MVSRKDIEDKVRVPGVNKKLELIVPIPEGHVQLPLLGNEDVAVKYLGISIASLTLRERLLNRRREKGRTGVFLRYDLSRDESIEGAVRDLSKNNKFFRRSVGD
jgi:predicted nucleotidyltransferase